MAKELTTPLPGVAGKVNRLLESFQIDVYGFGDVALDRFPNAEERRILQDRNRDLAYALRPMSYTTTDKDKAAKALAAMFAGIPSMRAADAADTIAAYIMHLDHLPAQAVCAACEVISRGRVGDLKPDYPPTSMRVAKEAQRWIAPLATERNKIDTILDARKLMAAPGTEEQRDRIGALLTELAAKLTMDETVRREQLTASVNKQTADESRRDILRQYSSGGIEPVMTGGKWNVPVSPQLLASLEKSHGRKRTKGRQSAP